MPAHKLVQEAREKTLRLWRWLAEHPLSSKKDAPSFFPDNLTMEKGYCSLCTLFNNNMLECKGCPLADAGKGCVEWYPDPYSPASGLLSRGAPTSPYERWASVDPVSEKESQAIRKSAAQEIVTLVEEWKP